MGGKIIENHGFNHSKEGIMIFLKPKLDLTIEKTVNDKNGRKTVN